MNGSSRALKEKLPPDKKILLGEGKRAIGGDHAEGKTLEGRTPTGMRPVVEIVEKRRRIGGPPGLGTAVREGIPAPRSDNYVTVTQRTVRKPEKTASAPVAKPTVNQEMLNALDTMTGKEDAPSTSQAVVGKAKESDLQVKDLGRGVVAQKRKPAEPRKPKESVKSKDLVPPATTKRPPNSKKKKTKPVKRKDGNEDLSLLDSGDDLPPELESGSDESEDDAAEKRRERERRQGVVRKPAPPVRPVEARRTLETLIPMEVVNAPVPNEQSGTLGEEKTESTAGPMDIAPPVISERPVISAAEAAGKRRGRPPKDPEAPVDDNLRDQLRLIDAVKDKEGKFDILEFLRTKPVNIPLAELLWVSPYLRRIVQNSLRTLPKEKRVALCSEHPALGFSLEEKMFTVRHETREGTKESETPVEEESELLSDSEISVKRMNMVTEGDDVTVEELFNKISMSKKEARVALISSAKTGTHYINAMVNSIKMAVHLDNGCCIVAVNSRVRKRMGWALAPVQATIRLKVADGSAPKMEGEIHNMVVRVCEGVEIPLNVLSVNNLDVDVLCGRPFLELARAHIDCQRGLYHFLWNTHYAIGRGEDGAVGYVKQLTDKEKDEWIYHAPPVTNQQLAKVLGDSTTAEPEKRTNRSGKSYLVEPAKPVEIPVAEPVYRSYHLTVDGDQVNVREDSEFDLMKELLSGQLGGPFYSFGSIPGDPGSPLTPDKVKRWKGDGKVLGNLYADLYNAESRTVKATMQKYVTPVTEYEAEQKAEEKWRKIRNSYLPEPKRGLLTRMQQTYKESELRKSLGVKNDRVIEVFQETPFRETITIASWNVNSIRNLLKKSGEFVGRYGGDSETALATFLEMKGIDLLMFQETRVTNSSDLKKGMEKPPGYCSYFSFAQNIKGYSGMGVYAREGTVKMAIEGFTASDFDAVDEGRVLQIELVGMIVVIGIYAPNARLQPMEREEYKRGFMAAVETEVEFHKSKGYEVIVIGDWNMVYRQEDVWNSKMMTGRKRESPCAEWEEAWVKDTMNKLDLVDPYVMCDQTRRPRFSAWEQQVVRGKTGKAQDRGFRIDYALMTRGLESRVEDCYLEDIPGSDHIPLTLRLKVEDDVPFQRAEGMIALVQPGNIADEKRTDDWKLNPSITKALQTHWKEFGEYKADLFAAEHNNQFEKYYAKDSEEVPSAYDVNWLEIQGDGMLWANPPWKEMNKILRKVEKDGATVTIICPVSPQNQWYARLLDLAVADPVLLPRSKDLFLREGHAAKGMTPWAKTSAWLVSGDKDLRRKYLNTLSTQGPTKGAITPVASKYAGYADGKWVPWREMSEPTPVPVYAFQPEKERRVFKLEVEQESPVKQGDFCGARMEYTTYEGKRPTPCYQMDPEKTGGRKINIGILPELEPYKEEIEALILKHLPEFLEPGGIARTLINVEPMEIHVDEELVKKDGGLPVARTQRLSPTHTAVLNEYDDKMMAAGKIEESTSITCATPLLVPKKDGSWRIVFNYAPIAKYIKPLVWPLEPMDVVLQKMARYKYRSSFDHSLGYHQCPIAEHCRWLTAFAFPRGLRQYTVAPMGWKDSAEWLMKHLGKVYDDKEFEGDNKLQEALSLFRDDGQVGADTIPELIEVTGRVFRCIARYNGTLSDKKSFWFVVRVEAMGHLIGNNEIVPEEKKVRAVMEWPTPNSQANLRSAIGFALFLKHCVYNSGALLAPLYELFKKDFGKPLVFKKEWASKADYALAWVKLKEAYANAATVRAFDPKRPCLLAADASAVGIAAVAGHAKDRADDANLTIHTLYEPVGYYGRGLTAAEKRKEQPEREMLAVLYGVMKIEPYIGRKLVIMTDHKAWVQVANTATKNKWVEKWRVLLSQLPMEPGYPKWIFRPGNKQMDVDPLSRIGDPTPAGEMVDGIDARIEEPVILRMAMCRPGWEPYDSIARFLTGNQLEDLDPATRRSIQSQALNYFVDRDTGVLYRRAKQGAAPRRVPQLEDVPGIMKSFHGSEEFGHQNVISTYQAMARRYYWENMWYHVSEFIAACHACQMRRRKHPVGRFQLYRIVPPATMFLLIGMDGCSLPKTYNGYCGIFVTVDYLSGWVRAFPVSHFDSVSAVKAANNWVCNHSLPQWLICDAASYFLKSTPFGTWAQRNGIILCPVSSQNAKANGRVENVNGVLVPLIARRVRQNDDSSDRWIDHLEKAVADYNHHVSRVTGISPFRYIYGQDARLPVDNKGDILPYDEDELAAMRDTFLDKVEKLRAEARALQLAQHRKDEEENLKRPEPNVYQPGQLVWVRDDRWDHQYSTNKKIVQLQELCTIESAGLGNRYTLRKVRDGQPYGKGDPVGHWRLYPAKKEPTVWDYGKISTRRKLPPAIAKSMGEDRENLEPQLSEATVEENALGMYSLQLDDDTLVYQVGENWYECCERVEA